jgi:two-component system, chemotaxis family, protein-glutamate methylesterase/glutaminase
MDNRDVVAIGTSAGGVDALKFLASRFPGDFAASILVTIHLPRQFRSNLDVILTGAGALPAAFADDGESLKKARIYIAPPDRHLIVDGKRLWLGTGPRENRARPAIDPMMRSAAVCCGSRSIGVILTGTLGDGAAGLWALKQCGGRTLVQDPNDALFKEMPVSALNRVGPDEVVPLAEMAGLLKRLIQEPAAHPVPLVPGLRLEVELAKGERMSMEDMDRIGRRSVLACPDCGGTMWEIREGDLVRYRCHVGHAYSGELTKLALDENLVRALGTALRIIEERVALAKKLGADQRERGRVTLAESWANEVEELQEQAKVIRSSIARAEELSARFQEDNDVGRSGAQNTPSSP